MAEFLNLPSHDIGAVTDGLKRDLAIDQLRPKANQPRRTIDPAELEQMAATIRVLGLIQPIVARPLSDDLAAGYEIIAGERRWRAAQLAALITVPVIIRHLDEQRAALYSLAENVARSDLNPIDLAKGYHRVVKELGFSQTELAEAIGQNLKTVNRILQLLKLPEPIQALIEQGSLSAKHGELLLGVPKGRQAELAQMAVDQEWSVRDLERQLAKPVLQKSKPTLSVDQDLAREQTLWSEQLGSDVKLRHWKTGKVQITITVASVDEYQGIRERLGID
jgi:ParB family chromosome partitioning protein